MADATNFLQSIAPLVERIKKDFPSLLPYLSDPALAEIILEGAAGQYTPEKFTSAVQGSEWYRTKAPSERQWIITKLVDPARAAQLESQATVQVRQLASQFGVPLTSAQLDLFVNGALQGGWDAAEIQRQLVNYSQTQRLSPGQITATQDQLKATAAAYAIPLSDQTLSHWATQINNGSQTTQGFQDYAQQQAKLAFPSLAKQIDSGLTVKQIGDPYAQIAAQTLGIDPNTVDWSDPKWQKALQSRDKDGNISGPQDHLQWKQTLMTDDAYGYAHSEGGQSAAYDLKGALSSAFGLNVLA